MPKKKRILIVGGVAGGASCAARARRLSEEAEIVIFDRGSHVSFANCGLPYYVGNVIRREEALLVATPELFKDWFNIEVRLESEVLSIARDRQEIEVRNLQEGRTYRERYDALVLSPGAAPIKPPLAGIDLPGIFTVRTIPDSRRIKEWIIDKKAASAVVVGGGFIGLEMAENLVNLGLSVTIVEMQPQVMPLYDPEMLTPVHKHLVRKGVKLHLSETVAGFEANGDRLTVQLKSGGQECADLAILSVGVRPETGLARNAGLEIGKTGGIRVDEQMHTSDAHIWAVGDAVEVRDAVTGLPTLVPLAGPANRQGRIAADVIFGRNSRFRGVQGTSAVVVFGLTIASTGPSEKTLRRLGLWDDLRCEKIYLHPNQHASYFPGAKMMTMKLIFTGDDGRIIGAQAVGEAGVEKRIDVLAFAIQKESTVFDLEEAELCYCPQSGSAKDAVNFAGMIAANVLRHDAHIVHCDDLASRDFLLLDVRDPAEFRRGHLEGAVNIPLKELRNRLDELPKNREILTYCLIGQRSYYADRMLTEHGFKATNISGGYLLQTFHKESRPGAPSK
ncbi:FAD-dependent oxidoreductase [Desulfoferrobacter suflitae]|uniref:FAD-dependent oxidoreductase n=1 Tax=Desulfoferrobacter suflitae TaxID=2865782 RepID=UPI00216488A9|nr:FAD-dependent oxidoreductase [Desulfoferrobacter suflitae]MCK8600387.1 FAD-dependent oxidoreductase [Desulfoferrobacter suflitae]